MSEKRSVYAPYNFVPFSGKVQLPYGTVEELPPHDRFDPERKTGEIQITMTAETPVFISNGDKDNPHFVRGANGAPMISGSSVRGMVRENMQMLGFGLVRAEEDLEDYQIYFREMAAARGSNAEALKDYYTNVLGFDSQGKEECAVPPNVLSGYILRENGKYQIYPTKSSFFRVSRKHPDVGQFKITAENPGEYKRKNNARIINVSYLEEGGQVKKIQRSTPEINNQLKPGVLLYTGQWCSAFPNPIYLFPEADWDAIPTPLPEKDELSYAEDWEKRKNNLKAYYDPNFWKLPEEGDSPKPVFYIRHDGHVYCGMSLFLRIGYRFPLSHGLPTRREEQYEKLDYPHGILGFADPDCAYRSRVSFGDCPANADAKEMEPIPMILGEPKPSYYPGYVVPKGEEVPVAKHYSEEDFKLRGYKQYWLKDPVATSVPEDKKRVGTELRPLPAGTKFQGVIRYKNLSEAELGLLLWALRLDEGCYQSIGMGKPYGYGRMNLTIDGLTEYDLDSLYNGGLVPANRKKTGHDLENTVETYIRAYDNAASMAMNLKKQHLRDRPEIQDFLFLKRTIQPAEGFSYMPLESYKNTIEPLPTVRDFRKQEAERKAREPDKPQSMDDMLAALQKKFNAPSGVNQQRKRRK